MVSLCLSRHHPWFIRVRIELIRVYVWIGRLYFLNLGELFIDCKWEYPLDALAMLTAQQALDAEAWITRARIE